MLLIFILAWFIGKGVWLFFAPANQSLTLPIVDKSSSKDASIINSASIYLFGMSIDKKPLVNEQLEDIKRTKLSLKLLGVLISPQMSLAIIEHNGRALSIMLDEEIQKGVSLQAVYSDYVIIRNRGIDEKLIMQQTDNLFAESSSTRLNETQMDKLVAVKDKALKNPVSIMRYVRFQNEIRNGVIVSVKVWPRQEKEIFATLGFEPGDKLLAVDGHSVDSLSKSPKLWQRLMQQDHFNVTVIRSGRQIPLSVQLK